MTKPKAKFVIEGEIENFNQMDNLYKVMRREGIKLLKNWTITIESTYSESKEE